MVAFSPCAGTPKALEATACVLEVVTAPAAAREFVQVDNPRATPAWVEHRPADNFPAPVVEREDVAVIPDVPGERVWGGGAAVELQGPPHGGGQPLVTAPHEEAEHDPIADHITTIIPQADDRDVLPHR